MTAFELASILVGFFTIIIALLAFAFSSLSGIAALRESDKANRIAELALKISMHEHKKSILPQLIATSNVTKPKGSDSYIFNIYIRNTSLAVVRIIDSSIIGPFDFKKIENVELELNQEVEMQLKMKQATLDRILLEVQGSSVPLSWIKEKIHHELHGIDIWLKYVDEMNNTYVSYLSWVGGNTYKGDPMEITKQIGR